LKGLKLAYIGDGNNVCNSLLVGCAKTGVNITVARPQGYGPDPEAVRNAKRPQKNQDQQSLSQKIPQKPQKTRTRSNTDTFVSMGMEKEKETRLSTFIPKYQVNKELLSLAKTAQYSYTASLHTEETR